MKWNWFSQRFVFNCIEFWGNLGIHSYLFILMRGTAGTENDKKKGGRVRKWFNYCICRDEWRLRLIGVPVFDMSEILETIFPQYCYMLLLLALSFFYCISVAFFFFKYLSTFSSLLSIFLRLRSNYKL